MKKFMKTMTKLKRPIDTPILHTLDKRFEIEVRLQVDSKDRDSVWKTLDQPPLFDAWDETDATGNWEIIIGDEFIPM